MSNTTISQQNVAASSVRPSPVALRAVDRENPIYLSLVADIRRRGILKPLLVREKTDPETQENYYELCDGLHRFSAAADNGLLELPVVIMDLDDAEAEEAQLVANIINIKTTPGEVAEHLRRVMARNPTWTAADVAEKFSQSESWVLGRLGLNKLDESIKTLVNDGSICVTNAIALSKLPKEHQHAFTDSAMTDKPEVFTPAVKKFGDELKKAAREGRKPEAPKFTPVQHVRKLAELKGAVEDASPLAAVISKSGATTALEGAVAALKWVLSVDPETLATAEEKWNATQKEKAATAARAKAVAAEKKRREVAEKAQQARESSGLTDEELELALAEAEVEDEDNEGGEE